MSLGSSRRRWEWSLKVEQAPTDKMGWHFRPASAARKGITDLIATINDENPSHQTKLTIFRSIPYKKA